jgi:hypothetical protein
MNTTKKVLWRSGVIGIGFIWSIVLWHQQFIMDKTSREDQERIVTTAVKQSNQHSDQQIGVVRNDVRGVKSGLDGMKNELAAKLGETANSINQSIAKVGKPVPPEFAKIQFSLWRDNMVLNELPTLSQSLQREADGTVPVSFTFTDTSSTPADALQIVVRICEVCSYASEPSGFDKINGSQEYDRHRLMGDLPPGATFGKITVSVRVPQNIGRFNIDFMHACKTCGKPGPAQKATITILR